MIMTPVSVRLGLALLVSAALHAWVGISVRVVPPRAAAGNGSDLKAWVTPLPSRARPLPDVPHPREAVPAATSPAAAGERPKAPPEPFPPPLQSVPREPSPPVTVEEAAGDPSGQPMVDSRSAPVEPGGPALELAVIEDPQFYPARLLDVLPRPTADISLKYPENAARDDLSGTVTLLLLIDELGVVVEATVLSAEPPGYFEDAAIESFRSVLFQPAQRNGRPVKSRLPVEVTFEAKANSLKIDEAVQ